MRLFPKADHLHRQVEDRVAVYWVSRRGHGPAENPRQAGWYTRRLGGRCRLAREVQVAAPGQGLQNGALYTATEGT